MKPLPPALNTTVVAKRYTFLAAALIEISPQKMPMAEIELHNKLMNELLDNMCHSSAQVSMAFPYILLFYFSNFVSAGIFCHSCESYDYVLVS
jgi:proteasome activator subunit 4